MQAAEEKEARRLAGARLLLAGQSSIGDDDEDVFEGLTPQVPASSAHLGSPGYGTCC